MSVLRGIGERCPFELVGAIYGARYARVLSNLLVRIRRIVRILLSLQYSRCTAHFSNTCGGLPSLPPLPPSLAP